MIDDDDYDKEIPVAAGIWLKAKRDDNWYYLVTKVGEAEVEAWEYSINGQVPRHRKEKKNWFTNEYYKVVKPTMELLANFEKQGIEKAERMANEDELKQLATVLDRIIGSAYYLDGAIHGCDHRGRSFEITKNNNGYQGDKYGYPDPN